MAPSNTVAAGGRPRASLSRPLHVGSKGSQVRKLERRLEQKGLLKGPVDGFFDARTKAAVQRFERKQDWKADGLVGNRLWHKLLGPAATDITGGQPNSSSGAAVKGSRAFKTVNINVKSNPEMSQARVVHDVKKAASQAGLIGWNEIGPQRYATAIRNLGPSWNHYFPKDGNLRIPNPISWKKDTWEKLDAGFQRTHPGRAKVSPHRYITWVKLKHKTTGKTIIRMNTHLVSGAWSHKRETTAWRREMWNTHMTKMRKLVADFEKKGNTVIVGGDFNRDSYRLFGDQVAYDNKLNVGTHGKSTLDYVMHTRDDELKKLRGTVQGGYKSDHDAVVVTYSIKK